ncbi:hypothetical protein SCHPADRAFT_836184 [Schizopora paradoxa]|uniref:BTB domain-containing protein n=1 Tax=Schizopora paradoxa TaxID=27342 RepID=A0A0H2R7A3_9AGAM|nr:hypothetical protein SCHPADRAFT_836184 [Schizopora paradoxa]
MDVEDLSKLKKHEKLWFEDGNIVLATDVHLYCVHRGVLAWNSTVFKDMLELPSVGITSNSAADGIVIGDSWEGKPLVRMVGDRDEDVYHILMALYDIRFYSAHKPTTLPVFLSLIRMGTKYNFSYILDEISVHTKCAYPTDLHSMGDRSFRDLLIEYKDEDDLLLLAVAEQCDMKIILPLLYFDCAASPLENILKASKELNLRDSSFLKIIRGHEQVSSYSKQLGVVLFLPHQKCTPSCQTARMSLLAKYLKDPPNYPVHEILMGDELNDEEDLRASICDDCSEKSSEGVEAFRLEVWNSIPGMFELGTWDDYKRE